MWIKEPKEDLKYGCFARELVCPFVLEKDVVELICLTEVAVKVHEFVGVL